MALSRSDLDWLNHRPSLLTDDPGTGTVSLGPAEFHGRIPRADVAATLAELLHGPRIHRQILELNTGSTPIREAVTAANRPWTVSWGRCRPSSPRASNDTVTVPGRRSAMTPATGRAPARPSR
ncbi:NAD(P)H-binding protein [Streptomyces subrutilus]|uniref:NAD(P)H-binding protein n=1 Tax=Streptomyces subrutilus TaxID=36818 RepID=UPI002E10A107